MAAMGGGIAVNHNTKRRSITRIDPCSYSRH